MTNALKQKLFGASAAAMMLSATPALAQSTQQQTQAQSNAPVTTITTNPISDSASSAASNAELNNSGNSANSNANNNVNTATGGQGGAGGNAQSASASDSHSQSASASDSHSNATGGNATGGNAASASSAQGNNNGSSSVSIHNPSLVVPAAINSLPALLAVAIGQQHALAIKAGPGGKCVVVTQGDGAVTANKSEGLGVDLDPKFMKKMKINKNSADSLLDCEQEGTRVNFTPPAPTPVPQIKMEVTTVPAPTPAPTPTPVAARHRRVSHAPKRPAHRTPNCTCNVRR